MTVTIYDVAREAKVSMATVSRVLNGTAVVKEDTKQRVLDAIAKLGYRPNAVARGLASKRTRTIGVIVPDVSAAFVAEVVRGIEDIATMYDYHIILTNSDAQVQREVDLVGTMWEKQVDGLIYMTNRLEKAHIDAFEQAQIPVVLCSTEDPERRIPSVNVDNRRAGRDAAMYLREKGCHAIAYVTPTPGMSVLADRRGSGMESSLEGRLMRVDAKNGRYETALPLIKAFLQEHAVDGIVAATDELGIAAIHAVQDVGKRVPEDVKVMAFDNTRLAVMVRPEMTVVAQPMYDFGAVSMRLLTKLLLDEPVESYTVTLQHNVVEREST
ncbi:substrate-binding domain-containing protein [Alicyclobacillus cycloheptanicus]|uniref:LacI family transcriptional regulator n=1 Tax=Alicyclobacillus cycloheptanicus TaxID=1457 RepID=A0ABT9XDU4_9BACL|nr:substrate-binding domain-containing protein [Alicyclobacillus cycloheptanicus]MDQ0188471.1 LacI family transcriptional regulator [Alicyclobacillus cycloheptanicus]WDM01162.1 substrate-binding domain-containing protein [Alicyclobacillus cycloheptanicus]